MRKVRKVSSLLVVAVVAAFVLSACGSRQQRGAGASVSPVPTVRRAAIDIGSGSTKIKVADVVLGTDRVDAVRPLADGRKSIRVDYQADLDRSTDRQFSDEVQWQGIEALKTLKAFAQDRQATEIAGVAAGAFRAARNAPQLVLKIQRELGIPVRIATDEEEARLGFLTVRDDWEYPEGKVVVWDIGASGGSLTILGDNGQPFVCRSPLGSVILRDRVIREIQKKGPTVASPNPMSAKDIEATLKLAEAEAREVVPVAVAEKLKNADSIVVGVGPVHYYSIRGQAGTKGRYTLAEVEKVLAGKAGLKDDSLGVEYADTEVTNLCLVVGFMRALGIKEVRAVNVNLADGVLKDLRYWKR